MVNHVLVHLVDTVLGKGKPTTKDNYIYNCPFCHHKKPKLEINFKENQDGVNKYKCWVCGEKGSSLAKLFRLVNAPQQKLSELGSYVKVTSTYLTENVETAEKVALPLEYKPLYQADKNNVSVRQALKYLRDRNITELDIARYNLGFCEKGKYANMIIIPSYDEFGKLNYFVGRNFGPGTMKYKNPRVSKDIVSFEMQVNWESPIVLCEGVFDAMAIKRNAIPLLGKVIPQKLMKKIVSSEVKQVFVALDKDALREAFKHCEQLLNHGKEVFLVDLKDQDPSELGFEAFTKLLHVATPLRFGDLLKLKLTL